MQLNMNKKDKAWGSISRYLLERSALLFGNFVLKSKRESPIFFNFFNAISDGKGIDLVANAYSSLIVQYIKRKLAVEDYGKAFLFGLAYKAIPIAAIVATRVSKEIGTSIRWGYDRKEAKVHGEKSGNDIREIEMLVDGDLRDGDLVFIMDDVITRGDAKRIAIEKIKSFASAKNISVKIAGIFSFVDREEGAVDLRRNYTVAAKYRMYDIVTYAYASGLVSNEDFKRYADHFSKYGLREVRAN